MSEFVCLKCVMPICDEESGDCLYRLQGMFIRRKTKQRKLRAAIKELKDRLDQMNDRVPVRREYYRQYYLTVKKPRRAKAAA